MLRDGNAAAVDDSRDRFEALFGRSWPVAGRGVGRVRSVLGGIGGVVAQADIRPGSRRTVSHLRVQRGR
eukprot:3784251-Pyramimonas_sp.AAC.1